MTLRHIIIESSMKIPNLCSMNSVASGDPD